MFVVVVVVAWVVFGKGMRRARVVKHSRVADRRGMSVLVCGTGSEGIDECGMSIGDMSLLLEALRPQRLRPRLRSLFVTSLLAGCCDPWGWSEEVRVERRVGR